MARVKELTEMRTQFRAQYVDSTDMDHLGALDKAAESGEIDRSWIIARLMDNVKLSAEASQFTASNQALKMLGMEIGMFNEKRLGDPADKKEDAPGAVKVSVDSVNRLLESAGYDGPLIDLTKIKPTTAVAIKK